MEDGRRSLALSPLPLSPLAFSPLALNERKSKPMTLSNLERMIQLADDVFDIKSDPDQLDVNQEVIERLRLIHPATVSEYDNGKGPVAWLLVMPTSTELMNRFLKCEISEKELFELTSPDETYEAIYLCSALVLEDYRRKGITKQLVTEAVGKIRQDHPIKALFVWAFSKEGDLASETISKLVSLPLLRRI